MSTKKTLVKFLRVHNGYVANDVAGFDADVAKRLCDSIPPVAVLCDKKGKPLGAKAAKPAATKKPDDGVSDDTSTTTPAAGEPPVQGAGDE